MATTLPELTASPAGPLADVARALGKAPGSLTPAVAAAAHLLAAEQMTAQAESCPVCATSEGGLCPSCTGLSATAACHRQRAAQLRQAALS